MSGASDEARLVRDRVAEAARVARLAGPGYDPPMDSFLARTARIDRYPDTPGVYFGCAPVSLGGPEVEGGDPDLGDPGRPVPAVNVGPNLPPEGALVVVTRVANRFAFSYAACDGGCRVGPAGGATVSISDGKYLDADDVVRTFAAVGSVPVAADGVSYVYLDDAGTPHAAPGGYPAGVARLAKVTAAGGAVTRVDDARTPVVACGRT